MNVNYVEYEFKDMINNACRDKGFNINVSLNYYEFNKWDREKDLFVGMDNGYIIMLKVVENEVFIEVKRESFIAVVEYDSDNNLILTDGIDFYEEDITELVSKFNMARDGVLIKM